jgi:serine/threonine protein phosphatase PrpC
MEDVVNVAELQDGRIFMVICDGHGGKHAASFTAHHLVEKVSRFAANQWNLKESILQVSNEWDQQCLKKLGTRHYPKTTEERRQVFLSANKEIYFGEEWHSGTTVVCVLLDVLLKKGLMANLGDSRGVWKELPPKDGKKRSHLKSTKDHVPRQNDLGPLGGNIVYQDNDVPRINGDLAVGRALGDNSDELMGSVSHEPVISEFTWKDGPIKVVLGTDGVWDVLSNSRAMVLTDATSIVNEAISQGTQDNVTAGVIYIDYPEVARKSFLRVHSSTTQTQ